MPRNPNGIRADSWNCLWWEKSSAPAGIASRTKHVAVMPRIASKLSRRWLAGPCGATFPEMLSRRGLLGGLAAAAALAPLRAHAIGSGSKFRFGQLQLGAGTSWNPRPTALRRL